MPTLITLRKFLNAEGTMRKRATGCVFSALCCGLFAQTPQPAQQSAALPEFEVAVIRLNLSGGNQSTWSPSAELRDGQVRATNISMKELLRVAFVSRDGLPVFAGAPAWFEEDRWDFLARQAPDISADTASRMTRMRLAVRSFLTRELKLAVHTEQRPMSVYVLTVGKDGPKLQTSADPRAPITCAAARAPAGIGAHRECRNISMDDLAKSLPEVAPAYFDDMQVLDKTGLTGAYDFDLDWVGRNRVDVDGGLTIFGAVEKLGLKLKLEKLPMPVIVIDHVERPAQN
jgi:uncharacterized protein (TIGR03435 family)